MQTAFSQIIMDLDIEINELQGKVLLGDVKIQEKLLHKTERKAELLRKKMNASAKWNKWFKSTLKHRKY